MADDTHFISGAIHPRTDLSAKDLKALGKAISEWYQAAKEHGGLHDINSQDVSDLLSGELPTPYSLRMMGLLKEARAQDPDGEHRAIEDVIQQLKGGDRFVRFFMSPTGFDFGRTLASLREYIPGDLVDEVRIGRSSWNREGPSDDEPIERILPEGWFFLTPEESTRISDELRKEVSPYHKLFSIECTAVARHRGHDQVLFVTGKPLDKFVVVELTWENEDNDTFPSVIEFADFNDFYENWEKCIE